MVKSNQRITKIKRDPIEELLKQAEATDVENAVSVQPLGSDLTPYPDMNKLRLWMRDYLLSGLTCVYPVNYGLDGETYYTAIIDGLPLYTRHTKVIDRQPVGTIFEQPILSSMGTVGGGNFAMSALQLMGTDVYVITNPTTGYYYYGGVLANQQFTYYNPEPILLTGITFNNTSIPDEIEGDILKTFVLDASNDNSVWTNIGTFNRTNSTAGAGEDTIDVTTQYSYKYFRFTLKSAFNGNINKQAISYCRLDGQITTGMADVVTSKPGLWLSNLVQPHSNSAAGGWLRSNLMNDTKNDYDSYNSDVIGNYSFSFFQRGVLHRTAGSTHSDNDSYCQHWSPSAIGCISHEAMVIVGNELQQTYTSYQTLAVPYSPDMQNYWETMSKDIVYNFVDNNDNNPPSITQFNGRIVGDGWTFEYDITGNNQGSGTWGGDSSCDCDPEVVDCELCPHCPTCVSEDIRNSGLCIVGTVKYQNPDGTICQEAINECFQTLQAWSNPNNENAFTGNVLDDKNYPKPYITQYTHSCDGFDYIGISNYDGFTVNTANATISNCGSNSYIFLDFGGTTPSITGSKCDAGWAAGSSTVTNTNTTNLVTRIGFSNNGGCNAYGGTLNVTYKPINSTEYPPEQNVSLYACLTDQKVVQEANGIPWNYTCGQVERFTVSFSTEPCKGIGQKSFKLADNVNIDSLGNITNWNL